MRWEVSKSRFCVGSKAATTPNDHISNLAILQAASVCCRTWLGYVNAQIKYINYCTLSFIVRRSNKQGKTGVLRVPL